ncbi:MAG: hypothetical protein RL300_81 [Pseudomonadota bacterium]|jgi:hypothetical protein
MEKSGMRMMVSSAVISWGLCACAQLPSSVTNLPWQDDWGDRGTGVLARDYEMCKHLVEQRSSLMEGCMSARGWTIP